MFRSSRAKLRNLSDTRHGGQRSKVGEDRSSLPASSSQPSSNEKLQAKALIWIETLVKGLLHQKLLSSAMVEHCGLLRVDPVARMATADFSIISRLQAPRRSFSLVSSLVLSPRCRPGCSCRGYDLPHWIAYRAVAKLMYPWPWSTLSGESA